MEFDLAESVNCTEDYFRIFDSVSSADKDKSLLRHCGNHLPNRTRYESSANNMLLSLITSQAPSSTSKGFKVNYTTVIRISHTH